MRKWWIVLMAAVAIGATGILGWLYMRQDRKGPEITIAESKKISYQKVYLLIADFCSLHYFLLSSPTSSRYSRRRR